MSARSARFARVLLALRSEEQARLYCAALVAGGVRVTSVSSALACWAELECERPDLLIIERDLPWGGGDGVLAMLDEEPEMRHIPVIAVARGTESSAAAQPRRLVFGDYPSLDEFVAAVRRLEVAAQRSQPVRRAVLGPPLVDRLELCEKVA